MTNLILATSNGTGLGHITRQLAIALSLGDDHKATLFSLSKGLPLVEPMGIRAEYCPSYDNPWIGVGEWHAYLRDRLSVLIEETRADVVVFDGVAPYPGIGMAAALHRDVAFVWMRRGTWKEGVNAAQLKKSSYFDLIIEPADLAGSTSGTMPHGRADFEQVPPISLIGVVDTLARDEARHALGLPLDKSIALLTLGSGMLGEVAGPGQAATRIILEESEWELAVTRSSVAKNLVPLGSSERVHEISGVYPLVRYLSAFDLAISSAGYNAVHELIPAGLPTILVANTSTRTDDQSSRAFGLAAAGRALAVEDHDLTGLHDEISKALSEDSRLDLAAAAADTRQLVDGAHVAARIVSDYGESFGTRSRRPSVYARLQYQNAKELAKRLMGPRLTDRVKRAMGRVPSVSGQRTRVSINSVPSSPEETELFFTESITPGILGSIPVEHVLPGSSEDYRAKRLALIGDYYDVADGLGEGL
ncbi:MAG: glycosyltransferase [Acidimicrobiia bacterium]